MGACVCPCVRSAFGGLRRVRVRPFRLKELGRCWGSTYTSKTRRLEVCVEVPVVGWMTMHCAFLLSFLMKQFGTGNHLPSFGTHTRSRSTCHASKKVEQIKSPPTSTPRRRGGDREDYVGSSRRDPVAAAKSHRDFETPPPPPYPMRQQSEPRGIHNDGQGDDGDDEASVRSAGLLRRSDSSSQQTARLHAAAAAVEAAAEVLGAIPAVGALPLQPKRRVKAAWHLSVGSFNAVSLARTAVVTFYGRRIGDRCASFTWRGTQARFKHLIFFGPAKPDNERDGEFHGSRLQIVCSVSAMVGTWALVRITKWPSHT